MNRSNVNTSSYLMKTAEENENQNDVRILVFISLLLIELFLITGILAFNKKRKNRDIQLYKFKTSSANTLDGE